MQVDISSDDGTGYADLILIEDWQTTINTNFRLATASKENTWYKDVRTSTLYENHCGPNSP
jgi:hypothetical protein